MTETRSFPYPLHAACLAVVLASASLVPTTPATAQTATTSPVASTQTAQTPPTATSSATPARRRSRRRRYNSQSVAQPPATQPQTVGPSAEQRRRDAQILAAQKAQSAETARQQAIVTGNVVKEREAQQAEPRIQDAPGPGSQPLPGDPAVQPTQSSEPPRIQDAPGPAQTLPQAPPAQTPPAQTTTSPPQS